MKKIGAGLVVISILILTFYLLMFLPNIARPSTPEIQNYSLKALITVLVITLVGVISGVILIKKK